MLVELRVRNLGVIADLHLDLGAGMTAVTGETGAGKTLVVDAIELLVGGRADASMVRSGEAEAIVEGRFVVGEREVILRRVVSAQGRSRAYVDGAMATVAELAESGTDLVDLHGQHAHQSLLAASAQRESLDAYGGVDLGPLTTARGERHAIEARLAALGGDPREQARELDLLAFQVEEIDHAAITSIDEEAELEEAEDQLANVAAIRDAAAAAYALVQDDDGGADRIRSAVAALGSHKTFDDLRARLMAVVADVDDLASDLRAAIEGYEDDPAELARVRARRQLLVELRRKYGATLEEVLAFGQRAAERLAELRGRDEEVAKLDAQRAAAAAAEAQAAKRVLQARRAAATPAGDAIASHLQSLGLSRSTLSIAVDGDAPGDDVAFLFSANPGEPEQPLRKVASGGELARVMLALRLVLTAGPPTMVFDEVDAGIGGEAAIAVGGALAALAQERQVLVVTHLPQVAAFADAQVQVRKQDAGDRVVAAATTLDADGRVVELSRMLAGDADSVAARKHAKELLAAAKKRRAG